MLQDESNCHAEMGKFALFQAESGCRDLFIQVVILVVLRALQGKLEGQAILCHLIDPNIGGNLNCSRVSSASFSCLGCSICLS
jgi:hypothetical protein